MRSKVTEVSLGYLALCRLSLSAVSMFSSCSHTNTRVWVLLDGTEPTLFSRQRKRTQQKAKRMFEKTGSENVSELSSRFGLTALFRSDLSPLRENGDKGTR